MVHYCVHKCPPLNSESDEFSPHPHTQFNAMRRMNLVRDCSGVVPSDSMTRGLGT
jgi:hypothetical protein